MWMGRRKVGGWYFADGVLPYLDGGRCVMWATLGTLGMGREAGTCQTPAWLCLCVVLMSKACVCYYAC